MTKDIVFTVQGILLPNRRELFVNDKRIDIAYSQKFINHSADFAWGYNGSGSSQTALAILLSLGLDFSDVSYMYHDFKADCISKIPIDKCFKASLLVMIENSKIVKIHMSITNETLPQFIQTDMLLGYRMSDNNQEQNKPTSNY